MRIPSFPVPEAEAAEIQRWAQAFGVDRSGLCEAVGRDFVRLRSELDASRWEEVPFSDAELSLSELA